MPPLTPRARTVRSFFPAGHLHHVKQSLPICPYGGRHKVNINYGVTSMANIGLLTAYVSHFPFFLDTF
jgi:hypothetical protein